jgi:hypothetical protein
MSEPLDDEQKARVAFFERDRDAALACYGRRYFEELGILDRTTSEDARRVRERQRSRDNYRKRRGPLLSREEKAARRRERLRASLSSHDI